MKRIQVRCARRDFTNHIEVAIAVGEDGRLSLAQPVEFKEVPQGAYAEPAIKLPLDAAQELMDELWRAGLRPSEGTGSAGALAATQGHLQDMRGIALALLRKEGAAV